MSVLELARKAYERVKAERNGQTDPPVSPARECEESELSEESPPAGPAPGYLLVREQSQLQAVAVALDETALVGLDVETTGLDPRRDRIRLLSVSADTLDGPRFGWLVDCFALDPRPLFGLLAERPIVGHNLVFDLGFLAALGFEPGAVRDTMLLSQLLDGTRRPAGYHKLESCLQRELNIAISKAEQRSDWSQPTLSPEQLAYAAADVSHLHRLAEALNAKIQAAGLERAAEIESRCLPAINWLACNGVKFDLDAWNALAAGAEAEAEDLRKQLDAQAPEQPGTLPGAGAWNWNSPADVKAALAVLGITLDGGADDDALAGVNHPLADLLRRYRSACKRVGTYGRDWTKFVKDGRIYPRWRQLGAITGRMSCADPNLQNLPRDAAYRRCFAAPPGRVLVKADYSQIELRIAAKIANEARMIEAYQRGEDLHTLTAQRMTGKTNVTKQERQLAKPVNFGLIYGLGAKALRQKAKSEYGLDLSLAEAKRYRRAFFETWPGIERWHGELQRQIGRKETETRTLTGRRVVVDANYWHGGRANYIVQGTGGDGIKLALALLWERRGEVPGAFPVLAVHDEIVVEADAGKADAVVGWLRQAMLDAMAPLIDPVPVEVEVKTAPTWGG